MNSFNRAMEVLFWLSLGLIAYTYFLYPAVLFVAYSLVQLRSDWRYLIDRRNRRVPALQDDAVPGISFLIPAYNEEAHLLQKINNLREMEYPRQKVQILFVSDGSTDATNEILKALPDPNIEMILLPHQIGKSNRSESSRPAGPPRDSGVLRCEYPFCSRRAAETGATFRGCWGRRRLRSPAIPSQLGIAADRRYLLEVRIHDPTDGGAPRGDVDGQRRGVRTSTGSLPSARPKNCAGRLCHPHECKTGRVPRAV